MSKACIINSKAARRPAISITTKPFDFWTIYTPYLDRIQSSECRSANFNWMRVWRLYTPSHHSWTWPTVIYKQFLWNIFFGVFKVSVLFSNLKIWRRLCPYFFRFGYSRSFSVILSHELLLKIFHIFTTYRVSRYLCVPLVWYWVLSIHRYLIG